MVVLRNFFFFFFDWSPPTQFRALISGFLQNTKDWKFRQTRHGGGGAERKETSKLAFPVKKNSKIAGVKKDFSPESPLPNSPQKFAELISRRNGGARGPRKPPLIKLSRCIEQLENAVKKSHIAGLGSRYLLLDSAAAVRRPPSLPTILHSGARPVSQI